MIKAQQDGFRTREKNRRIVIIQGIIDRLVKDFGLVLGGVWCIMCQGFPAQCAAVAW